MEQVRAFMSAARQLGTSALTCIFRSVIVGFFLSLVLTLCCFWWGDSTLGMKYVFGLLFFILAWVVLSVYRILKGELRLVDSAVDSIVDGSANLIDEKISDVMQVADPALQFENAKAFLSGKCPVVAPLLKNVTYQQLEAFAMKSKKVSAFKSFASSKAEAAGNLSSNIRALVDPLKLVWHVPIDMFIKKLLFAVVAVSAFVVVVRYLMM